MNVIGAFSSDSREQYKADIYKVLCLPKYEVVHFRYKEKYIEKYLIVQQAALDSLDVVIFLSQGNSLSEPKAQSDLKNISVRKARVISLKWSNDTEVYHVRLQLLDFINVSIDAVDGEDELKDKYFKRINITESDEGNTWKSRVEAVKNSFQGMSFFNIQGVYDSSSKLLKPKYNKDSQSCSYDLYHDNKYIIKMSLGNPSAANTKLQLDYNASDIIITHSNPIESSVEYDDINIPVNVKTIPVFKLSTFLSIKIKTQKDVKNHRVGRVLKWKGRLHESNFDEYVITQEFNLKLNFLKAAGFGLLTLIAVVGAKIASDEDFVSFIPSFKLVLSGVLVFISASGLFYLFNKK
ncbi:hypothetical protein SME13J_15050 [Serratia marcescens]|nr:hypothetical protein SME13J_15050 [Serratia marcescens]